MKTVRILLLCFLSALLACCENDSQFRQSRAEEKRMKALSLRAEKALSLSIPETLIDETSYKPILFGPLVPEYKTEDDIKFEIEQIEMLISFSDDIVKKSKAAGLSGSDYVSRDNFGRGYEPYLYGLDSRLIKLGFFSSDDFINDESFYSYDHIRSTRGNDRQSYTPLKDHSQSFSDYYGNMFMGGGIRTVNSYDKQKIEVLIPRKEQLQEELKAYSEKELIGYNMVHKYNATNIYGGAETFTLKVHFDRSCEGYWYMEKDQRIICVEHIKGLLDE